jgi:hypothetical protein
MTSQRYVLQGHHHKHSTLLFIAIDIALFFLIFFFFHQNCVYPVKVTQDKVDNSVASYSNKIGPYHDIVIKVADN